MVAWPQSTKLSSPHNAAHNLDTVSGNEISHAGFQHVVHTLPKMKSLRVLLLGGTGVVGETRVMHSHVYARW